MEGLFLILIIICGLEDCWRGRLRGASDDAIFQRIFGLEEISIPDHEFRELARRVLAVEDGGDERVPEAGAEGAEEGQGVRGCWLGEGVVDGCYEAGPEVFDVCGGDSFCWGVEWVLEGKDGRGGDEGDEFGAGVGWEVDVWDAGVVEKLRAGGGDDEEGCEVGDLGGWRLARRGF